MLFRSGGNNATQSPQDEEALTEIVVSAQKLAVGESAQRVPISITAVNTELVRETQAISIVDVGRLAPNVSLQTAASFPGFPNFTIRGQSISTSLRTLDPTVTLVLDGMPLADPYGRSEEHTSELQSLMRISYSVFCLKKKKKD